MAHHSSILQVDLPVILPDIPDLRDRCVRTLVDLLSSRDGVQLVHVKDAQGTAPPQLCMHFDRDRMSLSQLRQLAASAGAQITDQFGHFATHLPTVLHAHAAQRMTEHLLTVPGILEAYVAPSGALRLEFDRTRLDASALEERLGRAGVQTRKLQELRVAIGNKCPAEAVWARARKADTPPPQVPAGVAEEPMHAHPQDDDHGAGAHSHGGIFGERTELAFAALCGVMLAAGWTTGRLHFGWSWLPTTLYVVAYGFGGWFTVREAIDNVRIRRFEIDTLMLVAATGAAALGKWAEGALLLFLFSLGHALEHWAMGRARHAIEALAELAPEVATVRREERTEEVSVKSLKRGDIVIVKPNERIAADGIVIAGASSVDQAPITGESVPVDKRPASDADALLQRFERSAPEYRVYAGTINGPGLLEVKVARPSSETTLARVMQMVTDAEAQRSPTQQFTEKVERIFVPCVIGLAGLLLLAWVVIDEPFSASFYRAMAVLVAASPCALAISVPSAVLSGVARAARSGVLIKGGAALENLGTLKAIAFDKTGTLTEGKPRLTEIVTAEGVTDAALLQVALAVEEHSDHPLAAAIVAGARQRLSANVLTYSVTAIESLTGRGIRAMLNGKPTYIGKPDLFNEIVGPPLPGYLRAANTRLVSTGRTTMIVRCGEQYLGVLGVMDTPRPESTAVMLRLRELGVERLVMISGDNQRVAEAVAKTVELTEARGDLLPDDKVRAIQALRSEAGKVAMVGDGVNDAPAMASATVGIAMGAAGSDVALETADVALMADDLTRLPFSVALSRRASGVIRQNLWVSLGVVAVLIPATILGLNIGTAVLFHEGSTLLVVCNALRLLAYKQDWITSPK